MSSKKRPGGSLTRLKRELGCLYKAKGSAVLQALPGGFERSHTYSGRERPVTYREKSDRACIPAEVIHHVYRER